jgi:hypothetical protein
MKIKLNPSLPSDVSTVLDAAALLDTSEFNIFTIGYNKWFGENASIKAIENYYAAYMYNAVVPYWARHFARTIIQLSNTGRLNPNNFIEEKTLVSKKSIQIARIFIISGMVTMLVLLLGANIAVQNSTFTLGCFPLPVINCLIIYVSEFPCMTGYL